MKTDKKLKGRDMINIGIWQFGPVKLKLQQKKLDSPEPKPERNCFAPEHRTS
ncbi:MAG: hypothetical protein K6A39_06700 [Clostridiales bacterium]|nr:hypothetical protein [Clostridiales bacterium]